VSVLDDVDDDFRLTIFKMKPSQGTDGGDYINHQHHEPPDAYRLMGRGTVSNDYANQALSRVLRPIGLPV